MASKTVIKPINLFTLTQGRDTANLVTSFQEGSKELIISAVFIPADIVVANMYPAAICPLSVTMMGLLAHATT